MKNAGKGFLVLVIVSFFAALALFWGIVSACAPGSGVAIFGVLAFAFFVALLTFVIVPIYGFLWLKKKKDGIVIANFILLVLASRFFVLRYAEACIELYCLLLPILVLLCMLSNYLEKKFLLSGVNLMIFLLTVAFCLGKNFELYFR